MFGHHVILPEGNAVLPSVLLPDPAKIRQPEHMIDHKSLHRASPAATQEHGTLAVLHTVATTRRHAVFALSTLLAGCAVAGGAGNVATMKDAGQMSNPLVKTYETYLSAWSAIPDEERARRLRESLSESIVFTNPMKTRRGLADVAEHLQGFQQRSPGGSFRLNEMLGWERHGIATWQLVDAQGQAGFWGYDVVGYDDQGRIESILLFSHIEKQTLK
jgi:hypothetical protein